MMNIEIFNIADMPAAARNKAKGKWVIDDLHPAQQAQARSADKVVIKHDQNTTILAPTGKLVDVVKAIIASS